MLYIWTLSQIFNFSRTKLFTFYIKIFYHLLTMAESSIAEILNASTIDESIDAEDAEKNMKTLNERIGTHKIDLTNYEKHTLTPRQVRIGR